MLSKKLFTYIATFFIVTAVTACSWADSFSFTGTFSQDDDVQLFGFSVDATSDVTFRSYSYAGGTMADGTVIAAGGFDPILALFDSSGVFIASMDDGRDVVDLATGYRWDIEFTKSLGLGDYIVGLMQFDNRASGSNLSDGFDRDGQGNFTTQFGSTSSQEGAFRDFKGNQRTNAWALDILNVSSAASATQDFQAVDVQAVPEPTTVALLGIGLVGLAGAEVRRRRKNKTVVNS